MQSSRQKRPAVIDRRTMLVASGLGVAGYAFGRPGVTQAASQKQTGKAKTTILFFLCGGASHLDMWDMKPNAPEDYRGPFKAIETTAPGVRLSEHLPLLAKQAHHLALVNSVGATVNTNDHHAGYYYNLTGHVPDPTFLSLGNNRTPYPDDWPYMGSVVALSSPSTQRVAQRYHTAAQAEPRTVHAARPIRRENRPGT